LAGNYDRYPHKTGQASEQPCEPEKTSDKFNFRPSPTDPYHLFLLMKDILRFLA